MVFSRWIRSGGLAACLALAALPAVGVLGGCGGETVEEGEVLDTDPRQNEDVMKRTMEFYKSQGKKAG